MEQCRGFLHVVEEGDTLYLLSRRYEIPLSLILLSNPYINVYNLQPGDEICIPRVTNHSRTAHFPSEF